MASSLAEAISRITKESCGLCRIEIGTAFFHDDEAYNQLGESFSIAVESLTQACGMPLPNRSIWPGRDVEKLACWGCQNRIVYAMLSFEDNSRIRALTIGIARRGTIQIIDESSKE